MCKRKASKNKSVFTIMQSNNTLKLTNTPDFNLYLGRNYS